MGLLSRHLSWRLQVREGLNPPPAPAGKTTFLKRGSIFDPKAPWGPRFPHPASWREAHHCRARPWAGTALASCCLTMGKFLRCSRPCKSEGSVPP